jgi:hypothetical protein
LFVPNILTVHPSVWSSGFPCTSSFMATCGAGAR